MRSGIPNQEVRQAPPPAITFMRSGNPNQEARNAPPSAITFARSRSGNPDQEARGVPPPAITGAHSGNPDQSGNSSEPTRAESSPPGQDDSQMLNAYAKQDRADMVQRLTERNIRPSEMRHLPDILDFGIVVKRFMGIDIHHSTFTVDIVLSLSWKDDRVIDLVPPNQEYLSIDRETAERTIWEPDIIIANRDFDNLESIPWVLRIDRQGRCFQVHRMIVRCKMSFNVRAFPFDRQQVMLSLASRKAMNYEVQLRPSHEETRASVSELLFENGNFKLINWNLEAHNT